MHHYFQVINYVINTKIKNNVQAFYFKKWFSCIHETAVQFNHYWKTQDEKLQIERDYRFFLHFKKSNEKCLIFHKCFLCRKWNCYKNLKLPFKITKQQNKYHHSTWFTIQHKALYKWCDDIHPILRLGVKIYIPFSNHKSKWGEGKYKNTRKVCCLVDI